jgi:hypothetical protein
MNVVSKIKNLFVPKPKDVQPRSIVVFQKKPYRFSKDELLLAGERGWGKRFDGEEDSMYFVSAEHPAFTVVKAGPHIIRVIHMQNRYSDDDEYVLSQLPQPEQKKAWNEHNACVFLEFFNDLSSKSERVPDKEAYASLAKLTLQLGDPNCAAIFLPDKNIMMPNDGTAEHGLRFLINKELPL